MRPLNLREEYARTPLEGQGVKSGFHRVPQGSTGFYRVLLGSVLGFYRVQGSTRFYKVLQGSTGFVQGSTGFWDVGSAHLEEFATVEPTLWNPVEPCRTLPNPLKLATI